MPQEAAIRLPLGRIAPEICGSLAERGTMPKGGLATSMTCGSTVSKHLHRFNPFSCGHTIVQPGCRKLYLLSNSDYLGFNPVAVIYYTIDGTMPNGNSAVYNNPITVSSSETVAAIAVVNGYSVSALSTATTQSIFPRQPLQPSALRLEPTLSAQSVSIYDSTPNATIYYTTNGKHTTASSTQYTGAITVSSTATIQAIAVASGYSNSAVASATYTINLAPTFTFAGFADVTYRHFRFAKFDDCDGDAADGFNSTVSFACSGVARECDLFVRSSDRDAFWCGSDDAAHDRC